MRILRKEIRRILSIKLLAILVLFSVCFSFLFLSIAQEFWNYSSSQWDVDFYRELVSEFGTELSIDEWDAFLAKRQQLIDDFMTEVRKSPVMQKYEIDTYDKYYEAYERLVFADNMTDEDEELRNDINRLIFEDEVASPISFKLQCMDQICDDKERGHIFTDSESADKFISEMYAGKQNEDYQRLYKHYMTADSITLIHRAATETVDGDLVKMLILSAVWCFVLILPYQIGERLRGIRDIQLCTKTGRKCFNKQAAASVMVGLIIGIMLCAVYAVLLARKGAFDFAACKISSHGYEYWLDMTYGQYLSFYAVFMLLSSAGSALLAYFVGRLSANYIAGIGIAIPTVAALCTAMDFLGIAPFNDKWNVTMELSILRACGVPLVCAVCVTAVCIMLKRDKVRDIL